MSKPKPGPDPPTPNPATERRRRLKKLRARLDDGRTALRRWMTRLKRSFHFVAKFQTRIDRLEREIAKLENA